MSESGQPDASDAPRIVTMTTYSAVRTTGIYCRPGCGARPRADNVTTFELAAAAEAAGYRACLKCRPYRVAGPVSPGAPELVCRAVQLIIAGTLDEHTEAALGQRLGVSARHLRRLFNEHLGVTPTQLAHSRRAHFARRLLDDSDLSIAQIAFASGFGSIRHFNRAMSDVFRSSPRDLRERRRRNDRLIADGGLRLRMPFNPPFNWHATVGHLARRAIPGVESVNDGTYRRTITLDGAPGVLEVEAGGSDHLLLRAHLPYWEGLIHIVERAAHMLGIDSDITDGERHLADDPVLAAIVHQQPGLRVPGAWAPFEIGVFEIINQTVDRESSRSAIAAIVRAHGAHVAGLTHGLTHTFPSAETLADASLARSRLLPRSTARAVVEFAAAVAAGAVRLDGTADLDQLIASIGAVPGVDENTAQHVALHLGHPDAFPSGAGTHAAVSEAWRPWRALAATHLMVHAEGLATAQLQRA